MTARQKQGINLCKTGALSQKIIPAGGILDRAAGKSERRGMKKIYVNEGSDPFDDGIIEEEAEMKLEGMGVLMDFSFRWRGRCGIMLSG